MDIEKRGIIRLEAPEIEEIVREAVSRRFEIEGFEYESSTMEMGDYWPSMIYRGKFREED